MTYKAYIDALAEIKNLPLDSEGYGYKYVSLPKILDHIRPILAKHGLGMIQDVGTHAETGKTMISTRIFDDKEVLVQSAGLLADTSGLSMKSQIQAMGAVITYMRRYQLTALLGIAGDEDTDAAPPPEPKKAKKATPKGGATNAQKDRIKVNGVNLWGDKWPSHVRDIATGMGLPTSSAELSEKQAEELAKHLEGLAAARAEQAQKEIISGGV